MRQRTREDVCPRLTREHGSQLRTREHHFQLLRSGALVLLAVGALACDTRRAAEELPADRTQTGTGARDAASDTTWPQPGTRPINIRRERTVDFTGDGVAEHVIASARGARYDSLDVALTIRGANGDTLWHEEWPSLLYFVYDRIEGKPDTAVARIVHAHVDSLLVDEKFSMTGGLPAPLRRGGDPATIMREALQYHLAELDWRNAADLTPRDPTPPDAHSRINAQQVARERVDVVLRELAGRPSLMYFAGGEATYAIAWSERENAFVRIFACC